MVKGRISMSGRLSARHGYFWGGHALMQLVMRDSASCVDQLWPVGSTLRGRCAATRYINMHVCFRCHSQVCLPGALSQDQAACCDIALICLPATLFPSRSPKSAQSKTQVLLSCLFRYCPHLPACYYLPQPKTQECPVEDPSVIILPVAILPSFACLLVSSPAEDPRVPSRRPKCVLPSQLDIFGQLVKCT